MTQKVTVEERFIHRWRNTDTASNHMEPGDRWGAAQVHYDECDVPINVFQAFVDKDGKDTSRSLYVGTRLPGTVFWQLKEKLQAEDLIDEWINLGDLPYFPMRRRVACYAITGGNEGHLVHVDVIDLHDSKKPARSFLASKTFRGWDHAWTLAKRIAELLGA